MPAPHRTACKGNTQSTFEWILPSRPSVFMCPMVGSIADRRLIIFRNALVMPRFYPDRRIWVFGTSTPWHPLSTMAILGWRSVRMLTCSKVSAKVWPSQGLASMDRMPTTMPSFRVVPTKTLTPNSQGFLALPLEMHSTSGACRA